MIRMFLWEALMLRLCIPKLFNGWDSIWIILMAVAGITFAYYSVKRKIRIHFTHWSYTTNKVKHLIWRWGNSDTIWEIIEYKFKN